MRHLRAPHREAITDPDACIEWVEKRSGRSEPCGEKGDRYSAEAPLERGYVIRGPYCTEHGGRARAQREVEASWEMVAPAVEHLRTAEQVLHAGSQSLRSEHAVVRLVELPPNNGGGWEVGLGTGSHYRALRTGEPRRTQKGGRGRVRPAGERTARHLTREAALKSGLEEWRKALDARVEEIRRLRGGTLEWGVALVVREEPEVEERRR